MRVLGPVSVATRSRRRGHAATQVARFHPAHGSGSGSTDATDATMGHPFQFFSFILLTVSCTATPAPTAVPTDHTNQPDPCRNTIGPTTIHYTDNFGRDVPLDCIHNIVLGER